LDLQRSEEKTDAVFDVVGFLRPGLVGADEVIESGFDPEAPPNPAVIKAQAEAQTAQQKAGLEAAKDQRQAALDERTVSA